MKRRLLKIRVGSLVLVLILLIGSCITLTSSLFGDIVEEISPNKEEGSEVDEPKMGYLSRNNGGLANSSWPKYRGNQYNTGLSLYNTSDNNGKIRWKFDGESFQSPSIGTDGTIYVGIWGQYKFYAINPNGTEKWNITTCCLQTPTISSDGTIYLSSGRLTAIYPNGTEKWNLTYFTATSSPALSSDGTIYIGSAEGKLFAIDPNGTEKWNFTTGGKIGDSSPAIASDGTIYIGSWDKKLYAIYPNGTERWNFTTLWWVESSPAIGSDGTIYFGSDDNYLYALYPNGTEKWRFYLGKSVESSPGIGPDGTIYITSNDGIMYALYPNGTEKWRFTGPGGESTPAISSEGTIYIGDAGGDKKLYAIYPNGTEKWSYKPGGEIHTSPAIGPDGTVYIGFFNGLYAFGNTSKNQRPIANAGPNHYGIKVNETVYFDGNASYDIDGDNLSYKWDFGDGNATGWQNMSYTYHSYTIPYDYLVILTVSDGEFNSTDRCYVHVIENVSNQPPISDAGPDQEIKINQTVYFDDGGSYDPDGDDLIVKWDFGDGNSTGWQNSTNTSHLYTVELESGSFYPTHVKTGGAYIGEQTLISDCTLINGLVTFNGRITKIGDLIINGSLVVYGTLFVHGRIAITPNGTITYMVNLNVSDGEFFDNDICAITISHYGEKFNRAPVAYAGPDQEVEINQTVFFNGGSSYDSDGDILSYMWNFGDGNSTDWSNQSSTTHVFSQVGNFTVILFVNDSLLTSFDSCIVIVITKTNQSGNQSNQSNQTKNWAPIFTSKPEKNATVGIEWTYEPIVTDKDNDEITLNLTIGPHGMSFTTGILSWIPKQTQVGNHSIHIRAADGKINVYQEFIITVKNKTKQQNQTQPDNKENFTAPIIIETSPNDFNNISVNDSEFKIIFSKSMNTSSVQKALTITPNANYTLIWNHNNTILVIRIIDILEYDRFYSIIINNSTKDLWGNNLKESYIIDFKTEPKGSDRDEGPDRVESSIWDNQLFLLFILLLIVIIILNILFIIKYKRRNKSRREGKDTDNDGRQEIKTGSIAEEFYGSLESNNDSETFINELKDESLESDNFIDLNVNGDKILEKIDQKFRNGEISKTTYDYAKEIIIKEE